MPARPDVTIRAKDSTDDAFIAKLGSGAFAEYARNPERAVVGMTARAETLVALEGTRRAGFAIVEMSSNGDAHLAAISVVEDLRGRGIGRILLDAAEKVALTRHAHTMTLATAAANLGALDLFLRAGYEWVRRLPRYYERGQDAVRLKKLLSGTPFPRPPVP